MVDLSIDLLFSIALRSRLGTALPAPGPETMAERNSHDLKDRVVGTKCSQRIFYFKVVTTKSICLAPRFIIQDNYPLPLMITRHLF